jgi:hypothetical protein
MSYLELKNGWGINPKFVVHVGAHKAEEYEVYSRWEPERVLWVEAQPKLIADLKLRFAGDKSNLVEEAAIWEQSGLPLQLHIANNGQSTSLLKFGLHSKLYPKIQFNGSVQVTTKTLDEILVHDKEIDLLNIDIQGSELHALKGGMSALERTKWIYLEVNSVEIYEGIALVGDVDKFLRDLDFKRVKTRWWKNDGWGDALYIKTDTINNSNKISRLAVRSFYDVRWQILRLFRIILSR